MTVDPKMQRLIDAYGRASASDDQLLMFDPGALELEERIKRSYLFERVTNTISEVMLTELGAEVNSTDIADRIQQLIRDRWCKLEELRQVPDNERISDTIQVAVDPTDPTRLLVTVPSAIQNLKFDVRLNS